MRHSYLEVTFRKGRPLAAYYYLPRRDGDRSARTDRVGGSEVVMKYLVVVEHGKDGWGAHVPDLPGCIAAGKTREEVLRLIREAIAFHIEGLHEAGETVPSPSSEGEVVDVDAA